MFSLATLLLIPALVSSQSVCFNRNGLRTNDVPCRPDDANSACCGPTFKCMSNGLCAPGPETASAGFQIITAFYQGSCTDNAWKDVACPNFCTTKQDSPSGQGLQACAAEGDGKYCCWRSGEDCCRNSTAIFDLEDAKAFTTVGLSATSRALSSSASIATTSFTESDAPTPATSGVTSATNQWLFGTPAGEETSQAAAPDSGPDTQKIGAGVGVGVGIPLLIGILVAACVCFRRKKTKAVHAANAHRMEKPELDSWNPSASDAQGKHVGAAQQHEMDEMR